MSNLPNQKRMLLKETLATKNIAKFKRCIKGINWNNVYYINNIILQFDICKNNKCFPIESTKINYKNRNHWLN